MKSCLTNYVEFLLSVSLSVIVSAYRRCYMSVMAISLFVQQCVQVNYNESINDPHHWLSVRGVHQSLVDSPHKGPVIWKVFSCHDVFMVCLSHCFFFSRDVRIIFINNFGQTYMPMALCKTALSPLLMYWIYCSLAINPRYIFSF